MREEVTPTFLPPPFIFQVIPTSKLILLWFCCCEAGAACPVLALLQRAGGTWELLASRHGLNRCWAVVCCCSSAGSQNGALGLFCSSYLTSPATPRASALHQDQAHLEALCLPRAATPLWGSFVVGLCCPMADRSLVAAGNLPCAPGSPSCWPAVRAATKRRFPPLKAGGCLQAMRQPPCLAAAAGRQLALLLL